MRSPKLTVEIDPDAPAFDRWLDASNHKTPEFFEQDVIRRVSALCEEHGRIVKCLVFMPDDAVTIVFSTEPPYDFELAEKISELDIELAQRWNVFRTLEAPFEPTTIDELRKYGGFVADDDD